MNKIVGLVIAAFISIVLVASVIVPYTTHETQKTGWEYDDYVESDAVSASGALELVTVGSKQYLHASGVGEGTVTYSDNSTETVTVEKAKLKMLFIMGQSNGMYLTDYVDLSTAAPVPGLGEGYYYGTDSAPIAQTYTAADCAMHAINDGSGAVVGDLWPSLAATYTNDTGIKTYVVSACWGGKSIDEFEPENGEIWQYSEQVLADSMAAVNSSYYDLILDSYIWIQGEADDKMQTSVYIEKFKEMNTAILSGGLGVDTIERCFISKVRAERAPTISAAQEKLADTVSSVIMATEIADTFTYSNGYRADYSHYTQAGDNLVGAALGGYIANYDYPQNTDLTDYSGIMTALVVSVFLVLIAAFAGAMYLRNN